MLEPYKSFSLKTEGAGVLGLGQGIQGAEDRALLGQRLSPGGYNLSAESFVDSPARIHLY